MDTVVERNIPGKYSTYLVAGLYRRCNVFLFYLLHVVAASVERLAAFLVLFSTIRRLLPWKSVSASLILQDSKHLPKIPKHLAVVINEEKVSFDDVTNIIAWSFLMGIPCITIADQKGFLQQNCLKLQRDFEKKCKAIYRDAELCSRVQFYTKDQNNADKISCSTTCEVILSSLQEGRHQLVTCTQSLCFQLLEDENFKNKFDTNVLDQALKDFNGRINDPDLAITFGSYYSHWGFQPWNIRLTEILYFPNFHNFTYDKYLQALRTFAGCQQRFGT